MTSSGFLTRAVLILLAVTAAVAAWRAAPYVELALLRGGEPRLVAARGELAADEAATIALFEAAKDGVVFISTESRLRHPWSARVVEVPRGTGSGFVWDVAGHVVTNAHVLEGASRAFVTLVDGNSYPARLIGRDEAHDLAVLRIDPGFARTLPLPLGESGDLRVGQEVFAIGAPFGLDFTLTTGIVSALERELPGARGGPGIRGLIQTDAAINPGNSGGPLLDSAGRLIGVNTAIYSPSGASAGIGFAVPVDAVNRVVPQLIARGRYAPPVLGVQIDPRGDQLARRLGVEGALVLGVEPGSPAERAGIRGVAMDRGGALVPGDAVVALGGVPVEGTADLLAAIDRHAAGETVTVTLARGGETREVAVELAPGG